MKTKGFYFILIAEIFIFLMIIAFVQEYTIEIFNRVLNSSLGLLTFIALFYSLIFSKEVDYPRKGKIGEEIKTHFSTINTWLFVDVILYLFTVFLSFLPFRMAVAVLQFVCFSMALMITLLMVTAWFLISKRWKFK